MFIILTGVRSIQGGGNLTITTLTSPLWTGCTSRDWNTATNWSTGSVPTATDDVVIPSGPVNQPIISTTAVAKSVEVNAGASLSIPNVGSLSNENLQLGNYLEGIKTWLAIFTEP